MASSNPKLHGRVEGARDRCAVPGCREPGEFKAPLQPANFVFGRGRIDGRAVVVGGDDFTVRGGAADAAIWQKQVMSEQMAVTEGRSQSP